MRIKRLNGMFTVATQLEPSKIQKVAEKGYKTIICNRPNGEGADQPGFDEITRIASKFGLKTVYIPIQLGGASAADHAAFARAIEEMPKPILAYCRSGTRSATLWSHWEQEMSAHQGREQRVDAMQAGGLAPGNTSIDGRRALTPTRGGAPQRPREGDVTEMRRRA
ncbi:MAG: TIGR01244 family phosphatase [Rhodobacteraceae bacterium]|nr:TIGR01244 family phosphatase [Paracoccaceae bacterium]